MYSIFHVCRLACIALSSDAHDYGEACAPVPARRHRPESHNTSATCVSGRNGRTPALRYMPADQQRSRRLSAPAHVTLTISAPQESEPIIRVPKPVNAVAVIHMEPSQVVAARVLPDTTPEPDPGPPSYEFPPTYAEVESLAAITSKSDK